MTGENGVRALLDEAVPGWSVNVDMAETPARVVKALKEMTRGYGEDPTAILSRTFDADGFDQVVALSGVPFSSLCEHHLLPFTGVAGIAYLPGERVVGLSKLARIVDVFANRLQMQERMTKQIADAVESCLSPIGVAVLVVGTHACMSCRGVKKSGSAMTTSDLRGVFKSNPAARAEVLGFLTVKP